MARVKGLDISHWQGDINWSLVPAEYRFIYMKSSERQNFIDNKFIRNYDSAVGRERSPYHFWRMDGDPVGQAKFWRDTVGDRVGEWGPVVDAEDTHAVKGSACRSELERFYEQVRIEFGNAETYTGAWWWDEWVRGSIGNSGNLLIANYKTVYPWSKPYMPRTGGWADWLMWQHSSSGRIPGVGGAIDLNLFNGDEAAYEAFMKVAPVPGDKIKLIIPAGMADIVEVIYE